VPERLGCGPAALAREAAAGGVAGRRAALLLHRRLAVAPGALALCLIALALGLGRRPSSRPWAVALGAALVLGYHLLSRLGEALVEAATIPPPGGGWLPALACWAVAAVVLGRAVLAARRDHGKNNTGF
jgi:lipopolysaccharide export LptBFGC system permease protein LptF